jgi:hypothetical protein
MKRLNTLKRQLLADTATRAAYEEQAGEFDMARELIAARSRAGLRIETPARSVKKTGRAHA